MTEIMKWGPGTCDDCGRGKAESYGEEYYPGKHYVILKCGDDLNGWLEDGEPSGIRVAKVYCGIHFGDTLIQTETFYAQYRESPPLNAPAL